MRSIRPRRLARPLGLWALLAVVAVLNGAFREVVIVPRVGEYAAHLLSTALLVGAILAVSYLFFAGSGAYTRRELLVVSAAWTALTVGFEFVVGAVEGMSIEAVLAQYDVLAGRVWIVVPLVLFLAPLAFGRTR